MAKPTRQTDNEPWSDCPAGEVGGLVDLLQRRHRSEQHRRVAAGIACLAVLLMAGVYAIPRLGLGDAGHQAIVCADVHRLADEYVTGLLDGDRAARIDSHLEMCPPCRIMVEKLRSSQEVATEPSETAAVHRSGGPAAQADVRTDLVVLLLGSL